MLTAIEIFILISSFPSAWPISIKFGMVYLESSVQHLDFFIVNYISCTTLCYTTLSMYEYRLFFFLICIVGGGIQTGSTRHVGPLLANFTCPGWLWVWRIWWNEWQGKPKYSEKTCPDATLSTTIPTWPDPGLNPGRCGGKPATNRFSYGAAIVYFNLLWAPQYLSGQLCLYGTVICPLFERAKTVHALDCAATAIGTHERVKWGFWFVSGLIAVNIFKIRWQLRCINCSLKAWIYFRA
jgi:hypothetical protein